MRLLGKALLCFLAIGVALYAAVAYGLFPLGSLVHPAMRAAFQAHSVGIYTHIFASMLALALGPFQFSSKLRQNNISLHRWSGRRSVSLSAASVACMWRNSPSVGLFLAQVSRCSRWAGYSRD
jgi:hypothetical protein